MAAKMDLNKRCLFVLNGLSNALGKTLAVEISCQFKSGSVVLLLDSPSQNGNALKIRKEIQALHKEIYVICEDRIDWQCAEFMQYQRVLADALSLARNGIELAFVLHNEGVAATDKLTEPHETEYWKEYVHQQLYAPVALNQAFLQLPQLSDIAKLVVNITSSLPLHSLFYNTLTSSCKTARDMYFRAMADAERPFGVRVLTYSPGIMSTHVAEVDANNNVIDLNANENRKRVQPIQATRKLINILRERFVSGSDVDYYDNDDDDDDDRDDDARNFHLL